MYSSQQRPPARPLSGGVCCDRQRHAVLEAPGPFRIWSLPLPLCYSRLVSRSDDHHRPPLNPCPHRCHLLWLGGWEGRGGALHLLQLTWMLHMFMYVLILIMSCFIWEPCEAVGDHHNATCLALWLACLLHFCTASTGVDWAFSVYSIASGCSCTSCRIDCKCLSQHCCRCLSPPPVSICHIYIMHCMA